jgi:hypothetical protein
LLADFFAGIWSSCRIEKRARLYIDGRALEAIFAGFSRSLQKGPENRFIGRIPLH